MSPAEFALLQRLVEAVERLAAATEVGAVVASQRPDPAALSAEEVKRVVASHEQRYGGVTAGG